MQNFLPLSRDIQNHWVYKDNDCFKVWVEILFNARYSKNPKTDTYKGTLYTINYGEFLYSRPSYSTRLNINENKLRKLIDNLVKDGMIEKVSSIGKNKATVYKVINYEKYNFPPSETIETTDSEGNFHQLTTNSPPTDHQLTTTKEDRYIDKKEKKVNIYTSNIFDENSEPYKLAFLLKQKIQLNNSNAKVPDDLQKWSADIERTIRIDKRSTEDIRKVISFSQENSFWKCNILSAAKLREKFDTLILQSKEDKKPKGKGYVPQQNNFKQREYTEDELNAVYENT